MVSASALSQCPQMDSRPVRPQKVGRSNVRAPDERLLAAEAIWRRRLAARLAELRARRRDAAPAA
jgi:hypothetical protein